MRQKLQMWLLENRLGYIYEELSDSSVDHHISATLTKMMADELRLV